MAKSLRHLTGIFYNTVDGYPPIINGARVLAHAGWTVELLGRRYGASPPVVFPPGVQVRRIVAPVQQSLAAYGHFIATTLTTRQPGVAIMGHDMHGLLPARLMATRHRRPLIYHCHDWSADDAVLGMGGRLVRRFERRLARTADLVIVPDRERAAAMLPVLRLTRPPLIVANAPLAVPPPSNALAEALQQQGKHFAQTLLRQGRLGLGHALETTIRSIPAWQQPDWGLVLLGLGEADYLAHLQRLIVETGVEQQVAILPPVSYDAVPGYTMGATAGHALYDPIHINNRFITTASNKLMEYLAAGVPLLVSDTPAQRAFVERYGCGITADERDPLSIAEAVNQLLGDPVAAQRWGAAGQHAFTAEFAYGQQFAPVLSWLEAQASRIPQS